MELERNIQVIVIGNPEASICSEVVSVLHKRNNFCIKKIDSPEDLSTLLQNGLRGFLIFTLPANRLDKWSDYLSKNGPWNYFSVYYNDSLFTQNISDSIYLEFDFVIAGKQRKANLSNLLNYLTENYWRKIPYSLLPTKNGSITNLMRRILFSFEVQNPEELTLHKISAKLKVPQSFIRQEITNVIDLNFSDLKKLVLDYYQKNYSQYL